MKTPRIAMQAVALVLAGVTAPQALLAQGPLTPPPGAPAPGMKTLDQIEPRTPIDASHTPGDANNQFRITASGSYYLTGAVTGVSGKNGIAIQADDVTIDLGGFTLKGVTGTLDGIHVASGMRLTLRNGTIAAWGGDGVDEVDGGATEGIFEKIQATGNGGDGLRLGNRATVRACSVSDNNVYGLTVNGSATLANTIATNNGRSGIYFGAGLAMECTASGNGEAGIESVAEPVMLNKCVAINNDGSGLSGPSGAKIAGCVARQNLVFGIEVDSFSNITDCTLKNNGTGIFAGGFCQIARNTCSQNWVAGIRTTGSRNLIDSNQTLDGGTGILTDPGSTHNLIRRNTSGGNFDDNYDISADNRHGPVVDIVPPGSPSVSGSSATDTTTTTHPWANFAY